jgi:outer membrane protein assembly factor BamB
MATPTTPAASGAASLRLWPGALIAGLVVAIRYVLPALVPETATAGMISGLVAGPALILWWAFFSRAHPFERWVGVLLLIALPAATPPFLHESLAEGGMGVLFFIYSVPVLVVGFVAWAFACRRLSARLRVATMAATVVVACGAWALLRTGGITGSSESDFAWRWSPTAEQRLLAAEGEEPAVESVVLPPVRVEAAAEWPGFRGPERDGVVHGVRVETDWSLSPPVELWRRSVGPGWSSFGVRGDLIYTQEQRGEDEVVSCYRLDTGEPVWRHRDEARFWESNGGAGPRATPTVAGDVVYSFGGTGILNALGALDGRVLWSRDVAAETGAAVPMWGFSASPLVVDRLVVVAAAGQLAAFDRSTGDPRWTGRAGSGYSSPHRVTIDGVAQILLLNGAGATSVAPADGAVLWEHAWPGEPIVQPTLVPGGDLLVSTAGLTGSLGTRRLSVRRVAAGWTLEERWTSNRLKPYFNDYVVHDGHAYGFDGAILACIDLDDGSRSWKGGRYGHGQLVLLAEQSLLLVLSEKGEVALVRATPDAYEELARMKAIEGKTWNHPVVVGELLLVRNGAEMVAFRLPRAAG